MAVIAATGSDVAQGPARPTAYGWAVFALSFGLLISDYMARQVLNSVFPLIKTEWTLSDAQLGLLSGVVAVMVGLLTFPLSLLADRWGRVKSLTLMAVLWSLATLLCAAAQNYGQMLAGRVMVGLGEAAYGSVGIALVISVFPQRMRSTLSAAFMAGGLFGQVLGVALGGEIAASHGWRSAFVAIGLAGLVLAILFPLIVNERRNRVLAGEVASSTDVAPRPSLKSLFACRSVTLAYIGSGLQLFGAGALPAWMPTFLGRYHGMAVDEAGRTSALLFLICGAGMVLCGMASDHFARQRPDRKIALAIVYCLGSALALSLAMQCAPGGLQLVLLGVALFLIAGTTGPAGAMVANLTPLAIHGTAFATLTLANNILGLAPGPIVTGRLADSFGLLEAFRLIPIASVAAAIVFAMARKSYLSDLARIDQAGVQS
ncbi:MFS transporter [Sphingomonas sp. DBB INV C78]|uniref:MFS transporter n=1 Tax=Sphingomonas sp. DBB INV C78 TaxID=3349434 RepID=UPI0036D29094